MKTIIHVRIVQDPTDEDNKLFGPGPAVVITDQETPLVAGSSTWRIAFERLELAAREHWVEETTGEKPDWKVDWEKDYGEWPAGADEVEL